MLCESSDIAKRCGGAVSEKLRGKSKYGSALDEPTGLTVGTMAATLQTYIGAASGFKLLQIFRFVNTETFQ